jgi:ACR3 family arsenite transporter
MILFSPMAYFFTIYIGGYESATMDMWPVTKNVLIYLGIPFASGFLTRQIVIRIAGKEWFKSKFLPFISPFALIGLLYTICVMFALQGSQMIQQIGPVLRVVIPLFLYFVIVWFMTMAVCYRFGFPYSLAVTQSFTAASNNFELAMAIAIATYGIDSQQALATTIGPLVEVPVLVLLVYVAKYFFQSRWNVKEQVNQL